MEASIDYKDIFKAYDEKFAEIVKADEKAREAGVLVGRYYREQIADGHSFYIVTKENKTRCKLEVVTGIGDDWVLPRLGEVAWVGRREVVENIVRRQNIEDFWKKNKEGDRG